MEFGVLRLLHYEVPNSPTRGKLSVRVWAAATCPCTYVRAEFPPSPLPRMRSVTALAAAPRGGALGVVVFANAMSLQCSDPSYFFDGYSASRAIDHLEGCDPSSSTDAAFLERPVGTLHTPNGR